jgi:holo-[acyl-carrier protein] synthase
MESLERSESATPAPHHSPLLGIGIDIVEVARIDHSIARHGERFLRRVFTDGEINYCRAHRAPGPNYAARFAAKEALAKAFGTGIGAQLSWRDIEVCRKPTGEPFIKLHGTGAKLAQQRGAVEIFVSLTHTATFAAAQVVITARG